MSFSDLDQGHFIPTASYRFSSKIAELIEAEYHMAVLWSVKCKFV